MTRLEWDSEVFKCRVGRVDCIETPPGESELAQFDHVHVRIPQHRIDLVSKYEALGFEFITLDFELTKRAVINPLKQQDYEIVTLAKNLPSWKIHGFNVTGSRLEIDPELKRRIPDRFWDTVLQNHCKEFAHFCICAVQNNTLLGMISCFEHNVNVDLFLVVVHGDHQNKRIGTQLLKYAESLAAEKKKELTTSVLSQNIPAMNFYLRNGFTIRDTLVTLHYSVPLKKGRLHG
jgi:ribosomal protein S18 acetylase RimI-like enzyme